MRTWVWWSAPLAPAALIGGWLLAQSRQPRSYDTVRDTLSAMAARGAHDPWVMTAGFVVLGACHVASAAGFTSVGRPARTVWALGGAATLAVAAAPQPSTLHAPAAGVAFVALALWPGLAVGGLRRVGVPLTIGALALLGWFATELDGGDLIGLSERAAAAFEACTPLVLLAVTRRARRGVTLE